jgi:hypothetical protein
MPALLGQSAAGFRDEGGALGRVPDDVSADEEGANPVALLDSVSREKFRSSPRDRPELDGREAGFFTRRAEW